MFKVESIRGSLLSGDTSHRKLIEWSPLNTSHFLVAASDLRLYQVPDKLQTSNAIQAPGTNTNGGMRVLSVNSELQNVKCLEWAPFKDQNDFLYNGEVAAGLSNGKVLLTSLSDGVPRLLKEFVPLHARTCNALSWNTFNTSLLAAGLDKVRSDSSLLIWDINKTSESKQSSITSNIKNNKNLRNSLSKVDNQNKESTIKKFSTVPLMETLESIKKPYTELGFSEATQSISWLPTMPSCIAVGTGVKWLRIYDLRHNLKNPRSVIAHSRSINGVSFDPFNETRLLTYSDDGIVKLWDIKKLNQPIFTVNTGSKNLLEVKWCPTRSGILSSISKDDSCVKIWDFKDVTLQMSSDQSPAITFNKPMRTYHTNDPLVSIAWHPKNEFKLLSIANSGMVELVQLHESVPIAYSVRNEVGWAYGKDICNTEISHPEEDSENRDIAETMRIRAEQGYSMDIEYNFKLASKGLLPVPIKRLYEWMKSIEQISPKFLGILPILQNEYDIGIESTTTEIERIGEFPPLYRNSRRQIILQICGWATDKSGSSLEDAISRLEERGLFKRATAIAVFHFQIQRAVQALNKGAEESNDTRYKFVAMALSGFSSQTEHVNIWRESCGTVIDQLDDPYLKSCFSFLCNTTDNFERVLQNYSLRLLDRVAFACCFLPDEELMNFITEETKKVIENGNIEGIPLTGLSLDGIKLFQNYIDTTTDIQTACLAMSRVVPSRFKDNTVKKWTQLYRELLDSWQLWHKRALFDISMSEGPQTENKKSKVFINCNFCNNTLELGYPSTKIKDNTRFRSTRKHPIEKVKIYGCPNCKQPLPYCAVCILPLHCTAPKRNQLDNRSKPARNFDEWFTWCQNCKHGGHSKHISDWFSEHTNCPVTDCQCNCSAL